MNCILGKCAHADEDKPAACASLKSAEMGHCGALYALQVAYADDGYDVISGNNPTIEALRDRGLITSQIFERVRCSAKAIQLLDECNGAVA